MGLHGILVGLFSLGAFSAFGQDSLSHDHKLADSSKQHASTIQVAANPSLKGNGIKFFLIGKNYRKEWIEPINVPVLDLRKEGLTPVKEGGGKETRSLQVKDEAGRTWSLRSVKKYPEKVIPTELKKTVAEKLVADDISASYPFGALSMEVLSKAAGVPYLSDRLVFIADDPALDTFREKYRNSLVLMEEKEPVEFFGESTKKLNSMSTEEVVYKLQGKNKNNVDQLAVLRARLLDNFVMDFDRHEGQWNWLEKDSGKMNLYFPVPKDRDQVFYTNQGLLPKIARGQGLLPELLGFRANVKHPNTFNRAARNFDRTFLTELTEADWNREIDLFLEALTDDVIDQAMVEQPKELQQYAAKDIAATLKKKKKYFKAYMMRYYRDLSRSVSITGSNLPENFIVNVNSDGTVLVEVTATDSLGMPTRVFYHRLFDPAVTKEIKLFGLEGDDSFKVQGGKSKIKFRMVGGPGDDRFLNESAKGKLLAYDVKFENNSIQGDIKDRINDDPLNNVYDRLNNQNKISGIGPTGDISPVEGYFLGLAFKVITPGFHKEPYSSRHALSVMHALATSTWHMKYDGDFIKAIGKTDLLIRGDAVLPTNRTNFFGLGNNTAFDRVESRHGYYHMSYERVDLSLLARSRIGNWVQLQYGPTFEFLHLRRNENKYVSQVYPSEHFNSMYQNKMYGGGELHLIVDTRNNLSVPTQGIFFNAYVKHLRGLNSYSDHLTQTGGRFSFYTDLSSKGAVVIAAIVGANHNIGNFELPQSQFLGFTEHLRGFVVQRFAGRTSAYNQSEVRIRLANINLALVRADVGVYGFNDVGRVWADGEKSTNWHDGYGGGIWIAAMKKFVLTGYLSFSNEVKALPWATIGFVF
ncbi:MAG: BamA/TamA family outer membrane protein [Flavisolibacter sp.]